jgi:RNA polymerase sigma-70 factor (ECF subfamily)
MKLTMDMLAELYRRYGLLVERRCARILGNPADGRDAAHEAFARAAEKLATFRGDSDKVAWLYRISTNVCLNVLRAQRRRGIPWQDHVRAAQDAALPRDEEAAHAERQVAVRLLGAIEDELTRALVIYVYLDDLSQGEAADLVGVSRATANTRLGRFREQARAWMGGSS